MSTSDVRHAPAALGGEASFKRHPGSAWTASAVAEVLEAQRLQSSPIALPAPSADWRTVAEAVFLHRVHGLLAPHMAQLGAPTHVVERISTAQGRMFSSGMSAVRDTAAISELLQRTGIDHLIVKGAAFAATVGGLPALRGGGDIDLWVRPEDAGTVELLAREHGWHRRAIAERLPQPGDTWRWRTLISIANEHALDHPDRTTLDLHWRLAEHQGELGFDFDEAYERSVPLPSVGPTVRTLCLEDTFVHIAQHGRKEAWPTLRHLVDVVRLVHIAGPDRTRSLSSAHRNVALALRTAAHIAPWLQELADGADQRTGALADEAWRGCMSLEFPLSTRRALNGWEARRTRVRYESWLARSAPDWATRRAWAAHLAIPLGPLVDPEPPITSIARAGVERVKGLASR